MNPAPPVISKFILFASLIFFCNAVIYKCYSLRSYSFVTQRSQRFRSGRKDSVVLFALIMVFGAQRKQMEEYFYYSVRFAHYFL